LGRDPFLLFISVGLPVLDDDRLEERSIVNVVDQPHPARLAPERLRAEGLPPWDVDAAAFRSH
jgi:hypothetical protein